MIGLYSNVKLGFAPTRRDIFSKQDALFYKQKVRKYLDSLNLSLVDIEDLNDEGLMYDAETAHRAARKFIDAGVDAVFIPHCNFGTEEAVATLGRLVQKPLLLWGPRDEAPLPDGMRLRDSQCGLFASSKVLQNFGVPFTYIENCRLDSPALMRELPVFLAAAHVVKRFYGMRIGQIGTRPASFLSVTCNESELRRRFGIHIEPMALLELSGLMKNALHSRQTEYRKNVGLYQKQLDFGYDEDALIRMMALKDALSEWAQSQKLDAVAFQCWNAFMDEFGISPCYINAELTGEMLPVICEMDICGAISSVIAQSAMLDQNPIFFADLTVRHPSNDNAELLWHCGSFPKALIKEGTRGGIGDHYTLPTGCPGVCEWEIKGGEVSICRFDGLNGAYSLLAARGQGVDGPRCKGTYLWTEFSDWPALERRIIQGPYIHHVAGVHGDILPVLREALRYMPNVGDDLFESSVREGRLP